MAKPRGSRVADEQPKSGRSRCPRVPLHQLHHIFRCQIEYYHRDRIFRDSVRFQGPPQLSLESIPRMRMNAIESCCNKSVPIYILPDDSVSLEHWQLLYVMLHNYLYRTWFRPYQSEIDWGQFIAQVIAVRSTPGPLTTQSPAEAAHFAASMSRAICAHTEATQRKIGDRAHSVTPFDEMRALAKDLGIYESEPIHEQRFLLLQSLFRAVAIVLWAGIIAFLQCRPYRRCRYCSFLRESRKA